MPVRSARILIVDGRRDASDELACSLSAEGYRVRQAADAGEAVGALHQERADLVLIGLNLPGWIDGASLAGYVAGREIPVVMIAATPEEASRLDGLPYPRLDRLSAAAEAGGLVRRTLGAVYGAF
jgi:DNA-binding response OmpR family regulator